MSIKLYNTSCYASCLNNSIRKHDDERSDSCAVSCVESDMRLGKTASKRYQRHIEPSESLFLHKKETNSRPAKSFADVLCNTRIELSLSLSHVRCICTKYNIPKTSKCIFCVVCTLLCCVHAAFHIVCCFNLILTHQIDTSKLIQRFLKAISAKLLPCLKVSQLVDVCCQHTH